MADVSGSGGRKQGRLVLSTFLASLLATGKIARSGMGGESERLLLANSDQAASRANRDVRVAARGITPLFQFSVPLLLTPLFLLIRCMARCCMVSL